MTRYPMPNPIGTRVTWTPDDVELIEALRKLSGRCENDVLRASLRQYYRSLTLMPWRRGGPTSHAAARRAREEAKRNPPRPELDADQGDAA